VLSPRAWAFLSTRYHWLSQASGDVLRGYWFVSEREREGKGEKGEEGRGERVGYQLVGATSESMGFLSFIQRHRAFLFQRAITGSPKLQEMSYAVTGLYQRGRVSE
jgi:hypothetical protein